MFRINRFCFCLLRVAVCGFRGGDTICGGAQLLSASLLSSLFLTLIPGVRQVRFRFPRLEQMRVKLGFDIHSAFLQLCSLEEERQKIVEKLSNETNPIIEWRPGLVLILRLGSFVRLVQGASHGHVLATSWSLPCKHSVLTCCRFVRQTLSITSAVERSGSAACVT